MLLASLLVALSSATPPSIEPCRQTFHVTIETPEPLLGTQRIVTIESCGSGIDFTFDDAQTDDAIAHARVRKTANGNVDLRIERLPGDVLFERAGIVPGQAVTVPINDNGRTIDARVSIRATDATGKAKISIDAFDQPLRSVLRQLQTATGLKIEGIEHVKDTNATFRFDTLPIASLLTIVASDGGAEVDFEGGDVARFSPGSVDR